MAASSLPASSSRTNNLLALSPSDESNTTPDRIEKKRPRTIKACQLCRARRVRCDNRQPTCSACLRAGVECIQKQDDSALVVDPGTRKILQRIDDLENILKSIKTPNEPLPAQTTRASSQKSRLTATTEEILTWKGFRGRYNDSLDLKPLLRASVGLSPKTSPAIFDSSHISDGLESVSTRHLVDQFFRHVHVKNPMLDEVRIRQTVLRLSLDGPLWDQISCLALLVCALGSLASSFDHFNEHEPNSQPSTVADAYFGASQRRIGLIGGAGGVLEAQCYFYSGVYLMTTLQPLRAWRCFTQALACCQDFACANSHYSSSSSYEPLMKSGLPEEECVYWSCWKSERELRLCLRLPDYAADVLSYPLLFPTPPEDMMIAQAASWYFYLSEISLRRLEYRCREEIEHLVDRGGDSLTADLENSTRTLEELAVQWKDALPPVMSLETSQGDDDVLKFILRGHYLNLWEIIYWPWIDMFINHGMQTHPGHVYLHKALQIAVDRIRINKPGFRHRHHGTWLMLQACTRSALLLIAARRDKDASGMLPPGWEDAVSDTRDLLRYWQYATPDIADRLRILEELSCDHLT